MTLMQERERETGNPARGLPGGRGERGNVRGDVSTAFMDNGPKRADAGRSLASRFPRATRAAGFTLLEMLAVIVLIGIIGAVVVTQVGKNVDKGKYGAGKAQLITLSQKIENYALDNGTPPQQLQALAVKPANAPNWQGPYAKASDLKDPWRHEFGYQYPGQHGSFDLIFYGQDGKPGGDGYSKDAGNWQ